MVQGPREHPESDTTCFYSSAIRIFYVKKLRCERHTSTTLTLPSVSITGPADGLASQLFKSGVLLVTPSVIKPQAHPPLVPTFLPLHTVTVGIGLG